jgi:lipopolysaccharide/colanic/teichoic acid biosynthesis glycosyltransferase
MLKRLFDLVFSLAGLVILSPLFLVISVVVALGSRGGIFYRQKRVGLRGREFQLYKFRTMKVNSDQLGLLTVGGKDPRITSAGRVLRRYKLDELPQLLNVLNGTMSLVGPRPEVKKYTDLYTADQKKVLEVRPGITDYASLAYFEESELLARSTHPESTYINQIMPAKLELNKKYLQKQGLATDISIIFQTIARIFRRSKVR